MSPFQPFDPRAALAKTRRKLPHWQQPGATYFVTFRLADALPVQARARLGELRRLNEAESFAWIERYLDAGCGSCALARPAEAQLLASTLRHFDGSRYRLGAFVVMPDHVHALVQPIAPHGLTPVVHTWKSYSANALQHRSIVRGQVWQEESFDRIVRDEMELRRFDDYTAANPIAARLSPESFLVGYGTADRFAP